jgi:hypothetical protein
MATSVGGPSTVFSRPLAAWGGVTRDVWAAGAPYGANLGIEITHSERPCDPRQYVRRAETMLTPRTDRAL